MGISAGLIDAATVASGADFTATMAATMADAGAMDLTGAAIGSGVTAGLTDASIAAGANAGFSDAAAATMSNAATIDFTGAGGDSILDSANAAMDPSMVGPTGLSASDVMGGLGKGLDIAKGIYGISQIGKLGNAASNAAAKADPFGPYRQQYAKMLNDLMSNPSSITSMPGWKAGEQAVQRSLAANGYLGSGNMMSALQDFGGNFFNQTVGTLGGLAGAGVNPGTGAALGYQGRVDQTQLAGNVLGGLASVFGAMGNS